MVASPPTFPPSFPPMPGAAVSPGAVPSGAVPFATTLPTELTPTQQDALKRSYSETPSLSWKSVVDAALEYAIQNGGVKTSGGKWQFFANGRPQAVNNGRLGEHMTYYPGDPAGQRAYEMDQALLGMRQLWARVTANWPGQRPYGNNPPLEAGNSPPVYA